MLTYRKSFPVLPILSVMTASFLLYSFIGRGGNRTRNSGLVDQTRQVEEMANLHSSFIKNLPQQHFEQEEEGKEIDQRLMLDPPIGKMVGEERIAKSIAETHARRERERQESMELQREQNELLQKTNDALQEAAEKKEKDRLESRKWNKLMALLAVLGVLTGIVGILASQGWFR